MLKMCEDCRAKIRETLVEILNGEHELCEWVRESVETTLAEARKEVERRGDPWMLDDDAADQLYEAAVAGQIAVGAAHLAAMTDGEITEEGGMDVPVILGLWAGTMMQARAEEHFTTLAKQLLGMGDN